jgi:23S rRNA (guanosine2251-2'-O)-methyltransferase
MSYIKGRNSVLEALRGERPLKGIIFAQNIKSNNDILDIKKMAEKKNIKCSFSDYKWLYEKAGDNHQGVVAVVEDYVYSDTDELIDRAKNSFLKCIVVLDCIQDPHNLGAIIRTSEGAGVGGIVIPERRSAQITPSVEKSSAGALAYMPVAQVVNLNNFIMKIKKAGFWVVGVSPASKMTYYEADLRMPVCLVLGNEGNGLRSLVEKNCDFTIGIPMMGSISSLNVSVSCGIVLYEILRQKKDKKA